MDTLWLVLSAVVIAWIGYVLGVKHGYETAYNEFSEYEGGDDE